MRWFSRFADEFERDADPINRYVGKVLPDGSRCKTLNARTSISKHIKAIMLKVQSKNLELDCFYVGEHRVFTQDFAEAKALVLAFCGESLILNVRMQRASLPLLCVNIDEVLGASHHESKSEKEREMEMEECEDATGSWDLLDVTVGLSNVMAFAQPPAVKKTLLSAYARPGHPLLSAASVHVIAGESLDNELLKGNSVFAAPLSPVHTSPKNNGDQNDDLNLHSALLRQNSQTVHLAHASLRHASASVALPGGLAWDLVALKRIVQGVRSANVIHDHTYRFKVYRSVFLGSQFVDWALRETACGSRLQAVTLGQALIHAQFVHSIPATDNFVDGPGFYRLRDLHAKRAAAADDDSPTQGWSKAWGRLRKGRKTAATSAQAAAAASLAAQGSGMHAMPPNNEQHCELHEAAQLMQHQPAGPAYKLLMNGLRLQWTAESKDVLHDWWVLFTLATRPHPRPHHAPVQLSTVEADGRRRHTMPMSPLPMRGGKVNGGDFAAGPRDVQELAPLTPSVRKQQLQLMLDAAAATTVQNTPLDGTGDVLAHSLLSASARNSWMEDSGSSSNLPLSVLPLSSMGLSEAFLDDRASPASSSSLGSLSCSLLLLPPDLSAHPTARVGARRESQSSTGQELIQHLLRTAHEAVTTSVHVAATVPYDGTALQTNGAHCAASHSKQHNEKSALHCRGSAGDLPLPAVRWIVDFNNVQLGVETKPQELGPPGVERCVLHARSAVLKQLHHQVETDVHQPLALFEEHFLEVFGLDSYVAVAVLSVCVLAHACISK